MEYAEALNQMIQFHKSQKFNRNKGAWQKKFISLRSQLDDYNTTSLWVDDVYERVRKINAEWAKEEEENKPKQTDEEFLASFNFK